MNSTWQNCEQSSAVLNLLQIYQGEDKVGKSYLCVSLNEQLCVLFLFLFFLFYVALLCTVLMYRLERS